MEFTAQQIATWLQGSIEGNPESSVRNVAKIEEAKSGDLCFLANAKYEEYLYTTKASVAIVNETLQLQQPVELTLIRVKDAYSSFALLLDQYQKVVDGPPKTGIEQQSFVSDTAKVGEDVYIGAFTYVGAGVVIEDGAKIYPGCYLGDGVKVGAGTRINAGVKLYAGCRVGKNVIIHAGCVIGADGFGFAPQQDGSYKKVAQIGNVVIEDNVEIGANTTIDRATMGSTVIKAGVKLDNLIQVAHNVEVGENTVIAAQTGVSGSTKIGQNCVIGGQVGLVGHIHLANGTKVNAQSGLSKSVPVANSVLNGSPAFDYKSSLKSQAIFRNLPELQNRVQQLEEMVQQLMTIINSQKAGA